MSCLQLNTKISRCVFTFKEEICLFLTLNYWKRWNYSLVYCVSTLQVTKYFYYFHIRLFLLNSYYASILWFVEYQYLSEMRFAESEYLLTLPGALLSLLPVTGLDKRGFSMNLATSSRREMFRKGTDQSCNGQHRVWKYHWTTWTKRKELEWRQA